MSQFLQDNIHNPDRRLDIRRRQRVFNNSAVDFDAQAWLHREVASRLMEHIELVSFEPQKVLDLGSATGDLSSALTRRFKSARVYALDFARQMLFEARAKSPRWFNRQAFVCAEAEQLCLMDSCLQLICSNLLLPWVEDVPQALAEAHRVLDAGGLLMLSSFGPQTLAELRQAYTHVDQAQHINTFMEMHDLGNALISAGFCDVVVDVERIRVSYKTLRELFRDLRSFGAGNINPCRPRGLMGQGRRARLERACEEFHEQGQYFLSYELVFAQGWKAKSRNLSRQVEVEWRDRDE